MMRRALIVLTVAVLFRFLAKLVLRKRFKVHKKGGIVITGASSGIGEEAASALLKLGYTVFAGVRKTADADRLAATYPGIFPLKLDVTKEESIKIAVGKVKDILAEKKLPLVALINNAGVQKDLPVELQSSWADRFTFDVNVFGLLDITRAFLPMLRDTGNGARIVNTGSVAGVVAAPGSATYSASKFAVEGLTDALRLEVQDFGISVSLVQPGYVSTQMGAKAHQESDTSYGVDPEQYKLYKFVFEGFLAKDKVLSSPENAEPAATTTTPAFVDAISSPTPSTRYAVAHVEAFPSWLIILVKGLLPDRLMDILV